MSTVRPTTAFTADRNKFAYAQAFSRTSAPSPQAPRPHRLRTLGARLHRSVPAAR